MDFDQDIYKYLKKLHKFVEAQNKKITKIEKNLKDLQEQVKSIKEKPINIERIEYKFDQLKVETLEGTLNIGITPNGPEMIEDYMVGDQKPEIKKMEIEYADIKTGVNEDIENYLKTDISKELSELAQRYNVVIDEQFKGLIIDDIRKQIDQRIQHYINDSMNKSDDHKEIKKLSSEKTIKDIRNALELFIKDFTKGENS